MCNIKGKKGRWIRTHRSNIKPRHSHSRGIHISLCCILCFSNYEDNLPSSTAPTWTKLGYGSGFAQSYATGSVHFSRWLNLCCNTYWWGGTIINWWLVQTMGSNFFVHTDTKMSSRKDFKKCLFDKIQDFPGYWEPCKHNQTRTGCRVVIFFFQVRILSQWSLVHNGHLTKRRKRKGGVGGHWRKMCFHVGRYVIC